ncbi:hypothetical protein DAETH_41470 (plasmid) [Deinococcus aetherius]|uniref:Uncharacterized protein n=1 Tax=Deinococcus aetherius TaxID=200252 RepID=A0ABM8AKC7_9DEIO|nr:hypothetical protein DAETH_41470 [Deinococcus aetherius]
MPLFHEVVAAGSGDHLNVLHGVEHGKFPQSCPVAPQLVGVNDLRHVVLVEQAHKKGPGCLGVAVFLKQDVQHVSVFVDRPPQPMPYPTDLDAHLVQRPPRTRAGFSAAQFLGEERREWDVSLSQGLMADLNTALVKQFLHVPLAEGEAVIEPESVADDAQGKTVAVGLPVSHRSPPYRRLVARTLFGRVFMASPCSERTVGGGRWLVDGAAPLVFPVDPP